MLLVLTASFSFEGYGSKREVHPHWTIPTWMEAEGMSWQPEIQGWRWTDDSHPPYPVDGRSGFLRSYRT